MNGGIPRSLSLPRAVPHALFGVLVVACVAVLYGLHGNAEAVGVIGRSALFWMVRRWGGAGGDLSHGWLIPLVSLFVVWTRRRELAAAPRRVCWPAALLVALALLLHVAGIRAQITRVSLASLVLLLWALPLFFYGAAVARLLIFPCAYLVFCIPMSFLDSVTLPLRLLASAASEALLNGLGIAVVRTGTVLRSASGDFALEVADVCSGLRYLLAMMALSAPYAVLTQRTAVRRCALFAASVPVAVIANVVRVVAIGLVASATDHETALRVYHDYSGYIVFAVGLGLLLGLGSVMRVDGCARVRQWVQDTRSRRMRRT